MSRSARLLELLQILRRHRHPVQGRALAGELGISLRTLYRDIATLQQQGAAIEGEAGIGYLLRPGFLLPPLMFSADEIEALVLGSRWVAQQGGDPRLKGAARNALARIGAVLPDDLRETLEATTLLVGPGWPSPSPLQDIPDLMLSLRQAIRSERKAVIGYCDLKNQTSERTLWPFAIGFFDHVQVLVAWCELRQALRHFRIDRILSLAVTAQRYPRRRQALLKEWRQEQGIAADSSGAGVTE